MSITETGGVPAEAGDGVTQDDLDVADAVVRELFMLIRQVKRSAERSHRRKADPYRSAMSMLTFYVNRAGKGLSQTRRR